MTMQNNNLTQSIMESEMTNFMKAKLDFIDDLGLFHTYFRISEMKFVTEGFSIKNEDSYQFGYNNEFYGGRLLIIVDIVSEKKYEWKFKAMYYDKNGNIDHEGTLEINKGLQEFYNKHRSFYECYYMNYKPETRVFEMIHMEDYDGSDEQWHCEKVYISSLSVEN